MYELIFSLLVGYASSKDDFKTDILDFNVSPIENVISKEKNIDWKAWIVFDLKSSSVLWWKDEERQLPIASLTKLMTALIIAENHELDELVKVSKNAAYTIWSSAWIYRGETYTVGDLLTGLLIKSWNDTAVALAEFHSWSVEKFVEEMNKKVILLWFKNTHFQNPIWFDSPENYSSTRDLAFLTEKFLRNPFFRDIVSREKWTIRSKAWRVLNFDSTNHLLWWEIKWVKTWTTRYAWECLITLIEKDWKEILFVLLWSTSRFTTTSGLIDFVFSEI